MKVVYVAGKFRGPNAWAIEQNVRAAESLGMEVAKLDAMPLIPHANTRFFHGALPDDFWLEGALELLRRCDAVVTVPGWADSAGARVEISLADNLKIPVFHDVNNLHSWLSLNA